MDVWSVRSDLSPNEPLSPWHDGFKWITCIMCDLIVEIDVRHCNKWALTLITLFWWISTVDTYNSVLLCCTELRLWEAYTVSSASIHIPTMWGGRISILRFIVHCKRPWPIKYSSKVFQISMEPRKHLQLQASCQALQYVEQAAVSYDHALTHRFSSESF